MELGQVREAVVPLEEPMASSLPYFSPHWLAV